MGEQLGESSVAGSRINDPPIAVFNGNKPTKCKTCRHCIDEVISYDITKGKEKIF
jgi:hypothetical protein